MKQLLEKVKEYIDQNSLVEENKTLLLAISGGPDSRALLDIIFQLRKEYGLKLAIAHFNHRIRGSESRLDRIFVQRLAKKYQLEVVVGSAKPDQIKSEAEARKARLSFLLQTAKEREISQILLGHNLSDQAETILANFIRGAGLTGLAGMEPRKEIGQGCFLIRPLLSIDRKELISYLKEKGLNYRLDSTNLTLGYTRNKIRHQLLAKMKKLNPNLEQSLAERAQILREIEQYLSKEAQSFLKKAFLNKEKITFSQIPFSAQSPALRLQVLREAAKRLKENLVDIEAKHLLTVDKIFMQRAREPKEKSFQGLKFQKKGGKILITKLKQNQ